MTKTEALAEIESLIARYLRSDVVQEAQQKHLHLKEELQRWREEKQNMTEAALRRLDALKQELQTQDDLLSGIDQELLVRPDLKDASAVDRYNLRVEERNRLSRQRQADMAQYNQAVEQFNAEQRRQQDEDDTRRQQIEQETKPLYDQAESYIQWRNQEGLEDLWTRLNDLFADLRPAGDSPDLATARRFRREIAEFTRTEQTSEQCGMLIRETFLGDEPIWLAVDTGSAGMALQPCIVSAMGWDKLKGGLVEIRLPGGFSTRAPQLLIPVMRVDNYSADNIKAIVLKTPGAGLDGLLGLNFLSRFDYAITGGDTPPELKLQNKSKAQDRVSEYDVFICHKSEDQNVAHTLFDFLRAEGYLPFFSPVSLGAKSGGAFQFAIDRALEAARHMIVVGSSRAHMEAPWVRGEWQRFEAMINNGTKNGSLLVLLSDLMNTPDLPVGLMTYQAISMNTEGWRQQILRFLPRG